MYCDKNGKELNLGDFVQIVDSGKICTTFPDAFELFDNGDYYRDMYKYDYDPWYCNGIKKVYEDFQIIGLFHYNTYGYAVIKWLRKDIVFVIYPHGLAFQQKGELPEIIVSNDVSELDILGILF